ncbi:MAG: PIN domain-containing protein [Candidatus Omnitrophota bacterium]|jgi:predicted nucleic acid-binding protein|nr:MAG: PIN domain-containing protein [Candidatus Omnitrophota bacterium]
MTDVHFLIDTHIFILLFNDRLAVSLPQGKFGCSIITEMELRSFPKLTFEEDTFICERLAKLTIYGIDDAIKEKAILLRRTTRLKLPDAIIAATAIIHHAILLTNDKELHAIPELKY